MEVLYLELVRGFDKMKILANWPLATQSPRVLSDSNQLNPTNIHITVQRRRRGIYSVGYLHSAIRVMNLTGPISRIVTGRGKSGILVISRLVIHLFQIKKIEDNKLKSLFTMIIHSN